MKCFFFSRFNGIRTAKQTNTIASTVGQLQSTIVVCWLDLRLTKRSLLSLFKIRILDTFHTSVEWNRVVVRILERAAHTILGV